MEDAESLIFGLIILIAAIFLIRVPVMIAKTRGISGSELSTIDILSWVGVFFGITWLIALVLSLVYQPVKWVDKDESKAPDTINKIDISDTDRLEKLYSLKEKGVLTEEEFNKQKKNILGL